VNRLVRSALLGSAAGAAGTTTPNAVTYLDTAVRGRPASSTPEDTVERCGGPSRASGGAPALSVGLPCRPPTLPARLASYMASSVRRAGLLAACRRLGSAHATRCWSECLLDPGHNEALTRHRSTVPWLQPSSSTPRWRRGRPGRAPLPPRRTPAHSTQAVAAPRARGARRTPTGRLRTGSWADTPTCPVDGTRRPARCLPGVASFSRRRTTQAVMERRMAR
jgi:hypothetical protein